MVRAVNFGSGPLEPPPLDTYGTPLGDPVNRRAKMWLKSREWLEASGAMMFAASPAAR